MHHHDTGPLSALDFQDVFGISADELRDLLQAMGVMAQEPSATFPSVFLGTSRSDRLQLLGGLCEGVYTTTAPGRFRLHRVPGWSEAQQTSIRALCLSLGLQTKHYRYGRKGYSDDQNDPFDLIEVTRDLSVVPCRLAALTPPSSPHPINVVEVMGITHDFWNQDEAYTSFRVSGDGLFLREDYLILGGNTVKEWRLRTS